MKPLDFSPLQKKKPSAGAYSVIYALVLLPFWPILLWRHIPVGLEYTLVLTAFIGSIIVATLVRGRFRIKTITDFGRINNLAPSATTAKGLAPPAIGGTPFDYRAYNIPMAGIPSELSFLRFKDGKGNYDYTILHLTNSASYPHLYLANSVVGGPYSMDQVVSLEGNFDEHFKLYVVDGTPTDALSIVTPDMMQTLLQGDHGYSVEIKGTDLFIIGYGDLFTEKDLTALYAFGAALLSEFNHRSFSWGMQLILDDQPANSQPMLKQGSQVSYAAIILAVILPLLYGMYRAWLQVRGH
ncbi:MAG: hypothetical protein JWM81_184 [Candidatus Saccharibacteria bacterium]|nr:hypothetical protein [Candidatus Saccharibacteria bacterium]